MTSSQLFNLVEDDDVEESLPSLDSLKEPPTKRMPKMPYLVENDVKLTTDLLDDDTKNLFFKNMPSLYICSENIVIKKLIESVIKEWERIYYDIMMELKPESSKINIPQFANDFEYANALIIINYSERNILTADIKIREIKVEIEVPKIFLEIGLIHPITNVGQDIYYVCSNLLQKFHLINSSVILPINQNKIISFADNETACRMSLKRVYSYFSKMDILNSYIQFELKKRKDNTENIQKQLNVNQYLLLSKKYVEIINALNLKGAFHQGCIDLLNETELVMLCCDIYNKIFDPITKFNPITNKFENHYHDKADDNFMYSLSTLLSKISLKFSWKDNYLITNRVYSVYFNDLLLNNCRNYSSLLIDESKYNFTNLLSVFTYIFQILEIICVYNFNHEVDKYLEIKRTINDDSEHIEIISVKKID